MFFILFFFEKLSGTLCKAARPPPPSHHKVPSSPPRQLRQWALPAADGAKYILCCAEGQDGHLGVTTEEGRGWVQAGWQRHPASMRTLKRAGGLAPASAFPRFLYSQFMLQCTPEMQTKQANYN